MNELNLICECKKIEDMNKAEIEAELKRVAQKINDHQNEMMRLEDVQTSLETLLESWRDPEESIAPRKPKRGQVIEKALSIVARSEAPMTAGDVEINLSRLGVKPKGDEKNFTITVSQSLRRLFKAGKIAMEKGENGRVTYKAIQK